MGIFGWDYPPGVSSVPGDEDTPCQVCGEMPDSCICPECPICGAQGDLACYKEHGMVMTQQQIDSLAAAEARWLADAAATYYDEDEPHE